MHRLRAIFTLLPILAVTPVSAQTVTTLTNNGSAPQNSVTPRPGSFVFSAGPAIISDRVDVPSIKMGSTKTAYGGYVALDYFLSKALSLQSELSVAAMGTETNILSAVIRHGIPQVLVFHLPSRTAFHFDVGARYYPLQLTEYSDLRLQPFVKAALGGIFYVIPNQSPSINIDPCPFISGGGGIDIALDARWSAVAEADYYTSLANTTLHTQGVQLTTRNDGILATLGIQYRF